MHVDSPAEQDATDLISGAFSDAKELASAQIDKLKAEARQVGATAKITGIGLAFSIVAAIMAGQALGFGLMALGLPTWAAFAIVAVVVGVAGVIFLKYPRDIAEATD
ncbi:MAG: phage holin family protein [Deltaproteobacteria bacterium]|nr:phage holin family protein [Deltaproteobacteria bacterium]